MRILVTILCLAIAVALSCFASPEVSGEQDKTRTLRELEFDEINLHVPPSETESHKIREAGVWLEVFVAAGSAEFPEFGYVVHNHRSQPIYFSSYDAILYTWHVADIETGKVLPHVPGTQVGPDKIKVASGARYSHVSDWAIRTRTHALVPGRRYRATLTFHFLEEERAEQLPKFNSITTSEVSFEFVLEVK